MQRLLHKLPTKLEDVALFYYICKLIIKVNVRNSDQNVPSLSPVVSPDDPGLSSFQLTERQKKICVFLKDNPKLSANEMSPVLAVTKKTIKRDLAAMQKIGVLKREGVTSAGYWVVTIETN